MLHLQKLRSSLNGPATRQIPAFWRGLNNATDHSSDQNDDQATPPADFPDLINSTLRVDLLAQQVATALASGRAIAGRHRPDLQALREGESEQLHTIKAAVPHYGVRPSLLGPLAAVAFGAVGVASALAPPRLSAAVAAGIQDALTDTFNEQLRTLRESGAAESCGDIRKLVRDLRDFERAPEGAPQVPDILKLQRPQELTPAEGVAAVVKAGTRLLLNAAKTV